MLNELARTQQLHVKSRNERRTIGKVGVHGVLGWHEVDRHLASRLAASPPTANTPGLRRNQKIGLGVLAGFSAMVVIGSLANGGSDKDEKSTTHSTTTSVAPTTAASPVAAPPATPAPTGPIAPVGVNSHTESGADGDVVFVDFDIKDALFTGLTKFGARETTKDILEYAQTEYPQAGKAVVQGQFPQRTPAGIRLTALC
jgi:hypothetical protein